MAYATINKPSDYFNTVLYTGDGNDDRSITGVGFQPDFLWIKERDQTRGHALQDSTRGATKYIGTHTSSGENTNANGVQAFESDGFQLGTDSDINLNTGTYVAWNWLANGGTTTSFSESGSNPGGTYQANTTSGFSIITYTGTGSAGTIPHGLGKRPKWISIKSRTQSESWFVNSELFTGNANGGLHFNATDAEYTGGSNNMDASSIDTTNIHVKTSGGVNTDGQDYVAYCFAEIEGYSKFGSYTGNGSSDGTFVYTGFKPAFVIVKRTDTTGNWDMFDSTRSSFNATDKALFSNLTLAEVSGTRIIDTLSNGFKQRLNNADQNASGGTYIYMAFAENPLVGTNGIPATAR